MQPPAVDRWTARIARARHVAATRPAARQALEFLADLAQRQRYIVSEHPGPQQALAGFLASLESAPDPIAERAAAIRRSSAAWPQLLNAYLGTAVADVSDPAGAFIVETLLQCFPPEPCPHCGGPPVVALLREAGHGARRSYVCGLCFAESPAPRLGCLACGEQRVDALPVYRGDDTDPARIDACDTCRSYLKTIDLTRDGAADAAADDIASLPLDIWARDRGYRRLRPNLLRL